MRQILLEATLKLNRLSSYLADNEVLRTVAARFERESSSKEINRVFSSSDRRLTDYAYCIITLYGVLENFNESIIKAYINAISNIAKRYLDLPEKMRVSHLSLTADLVLLMQRGQRKYDKITVEGLISNLNTCLNTENPIIINSDVFTQHTSNFRVDTINTFFSKVAVESLINKVKDEKQFVDYHVRYNGLIETDIANITDDILFAELNDIVQRRNEIAHGVENGDLLEISIIKQYVYFVEVLISSIYSVLIHEYEKFRFEHVKKNDLGIPIVVYDSSIICINSAGFDIHVNQTIYSFNETTGHVKMGKIISIKEKDTFLEVVPATERKNIGIRVDFKAKDNCKYFLEE